MQSKTHLLLGVGAVLLAAIGQPLPAAAAAPLTVTDEEQATAIVESVDQAQRSVLLRGEDGALFTIVAGPEVRNLAQLKAGDRVVVRYREALAASLAKPDTSAPAAQATARADRAPLGEKPGGSSEQMLRARVTITRIDPRHNMVSFVGPAHVERTVEVLDPEMQRFLHTLKVGDEVDLTYTEALAVSVEPAGG